MSEPQTLAISTLIRTAPGHGSITGYSRSSNSLPMPGMIAARPVFAMGVPPNRRRQHLAGRQRIFKPVRREMSSRLDPARAPGATVDYPHAVHARVGSGLE